jgi:cysteine synthase B
VTHFVAITGTSGTFVGTARRLRDCNPAVEVFAAQPDSPFHGIEGTKHLASTLKPGFFDENLPDGYVPVAAETAYATALQLARDLPPDAVVVTILADGGLRYLNDEFWEK